MVYVKNNEYTQVNDNFIYCETIYKFCNKRVELLEEKFYKSNKVLKLKKKNLMLKRKQYTIYRFLDLVAAPLEYLLNNNFKKV